MFYIPKALEKEALEKGYLEHPGLRGILTTCLRLSSILDMPVLLSACFWQQAATMSAYKFTQIHTTCCCIPDAPQKPLVQERARSGANLVQVTREKSPSKAKRPRTAGLQQPTGTHKDHKILSTRFFCKSTQGGCL